MGCYLRRMRARRPLPLLLLLFAPAALAADAPPRPSGVNYLNVGPVFTLMARPKEDPAGAWGAGLGLEVSYHHLEDFKGRGYGGFLRGEALLGERHVRLSAGGQATYDFLGLEVGASHETESPWHAATTSLQAMPFTSLGVFSLGLRVSLPVLASEGPKPAQGVELGLYATLKYPFLL